MSLNQEPCPNGTDRIKLLKTASIFDPKTKMELLKVKIGFILPYEGELSTLDEQLEWLRKEYLLFFEDDKGVNFEELDQVANDLKSREESLDEVERTEFNVIKYYSSSQASLVFDLETIKTKILGIITASFHLRGRPLRMKEYIPLFNEFSTTLNNEILETNDLRECLVVRVGLANRVRHILSCRRQRRLLPKIDMVVHSKIEPEPTPEPPKKKEEKPSKQSQTRSANKARDQKKREHEEYLRRVAEAEKARAEEEERKRRAKKNAKKI